MLSTFIGYYFENVDCFKYLGFIVTCANKISDEIKAKLVGRKYAFKSY